MVLQGKRSEIPDAILNSTNPADQAMMKGIEMAWTQDPGKRPSAKQIADFLYKNLLGLNGNNPKDYRISAHRSHISLTKTLTAMLITSMTNERLQIYFRKSKKNVQPHFFMQSTFFFDIICIYIKKKQM